MQLELREMLNSLAPGHEGAMAMQSIPTSEESLAYVGHCRTQLLDDQMFQESESFQGLLMLPTIRYWTLDRLQVIPLMR